MGILLLDNEPTDLRCRFLIIHDVNIIEGNTVIVIKGSELFKTYALHNIYNNLYFVTLHKMASVYPLAIGYPIHKL